MIAPKQPYWKSKSLYEMTVSEWESLCCSCGICCLHRFREGKSGKIRFTAVACRHLDLIPAAAEFMRTDFNSIGIAKKSLLKIFLN